MKHPDWCGVSNENAPNADYCLKCDDYDDGRLCESEHPNELVHRWEISDDYFGFGIEQSNIWISQGFNEIKPRAWFAKDSFNEADAKELTKKEITFISSHLEDILRILS
jgi:hypothetical protein